MYLDQILKNLLRLSFLFKAQSFTTLLAPLLTLCVYSCALPKSTQDVDLDITPDKHHTVYAINAGGASLKTHSGIVFEADGFARNASSLSVDDSIYHTNNDALYQTKSRGKSFSYELPVTNSTYKVTLFMAETVYENDGKRVQDVNIEGKKLISQLDLHKLAGHDKATLYEFENVEVDDGSLSIEFKGLVGEGSVAGILVQSTHGQRSARVFTAGTESLPFTHLDNRPTHRIPGIIKTSTGRIIASVESRESGTDHSEKEVLVMQSDDGGETWQNQIILGDYGRSPTGNPTFVFDEHTERLMLFYASYDGSERAASNKHVFYRYSDNHGSTWSEQIEITHLIPESYSLALPGPGHGIQMQNRYKGRLIIPFWGYDEGRSTIFGLYSDDHGENWHFGYESEPKESIVYEPNETQLIEEDDGDVLIIARTALGEAEYSGGMSRAKATSKDGGKTMSGLVQSSQFSGPVVMGSVIRMGDRLLFSAPMDPTNREDLSIRESFNNGQSWGFPKKISEGFAAYSDLVKLDEDTFGIVYEIDNYKRLLFKTFDLDILNTEGTLLTDNSPSQSEAYLFSNKENGIHTSLSSKGKFGNAVFLDGDSHLYISKSANNYLGNQDFTVNLWYKSDENDSRPEALMWFYTLGPAHDGLWTRIYPDKIKTLVNQGKEKNFNFNTSNITDNAWHMFTLIRRDSTLEVYLDGEMKAHEESYFTRDNFGENTDFGYFFGTKPNNKAVEGFQENFNGSLDEIRMYKRALSESEINALISNNNVNQDALVLNLSFD